MIEIGGYLGFEPYSNHQFYSSLLKINSGRNAIMITLKEKRYQKLWLPYYLCDSIASKLDSVHISYEKYHISQELTPQIPDGISSTDGILLVNYFGQFSNNDLLDYHKQYPNIIVDNTQSFFQPPVSGIDTVYTCRKYFGVPDGAYLSLSKTPEYYDSLPLDYSSHRMKHILGRFETSAQEHYWEFNEVEKELETEPPKKMSCLTQNLLSSLDYERIKKQRIENFNILHDFLGIQNKLKIRHYAGLYMYPFLLEQGSKIKKELIKQKIYVPTLWPNVLAECPKDSFEYYLADNLVLLPIDQRYGKAEMHYVLKQLKEILNNDH